ncbi:MAG: CDP-alcohol phosphatidyltransferase family protein [Paracoccaceae bacterium]|nr:MAG: CDP-alcohol phosphatidyltransferase family protein [Paracoccaceae bacterium]
MIRPAPSPPASLTALSLAGAGLLALGGWAVSGGTGLPLVAPPLAFLTIAALVARSLSRAASARHLGAANAVTLGRAAVACLMLAPILMPGGLSGREAAGWALVALALGALALDGVDGWLARRRGEATAFGARFDMETDALMAAVLAVLALVSGKAGVWVLALGMMRYGWVAAMPVWPWLGGALPERRSRKTVCVIQIAVLTALIAPPVVPPLSTALGAGATGLLIWSFGRDLLWLRARAG